MKPKRTWILVTDGGKARILENLGVGKGVHQVAGLEETITLPPNRELQDDRPGRGHESASPMRHAVEVSDPHRVLKRTFASHLVDELSALHRKGAFDRLVLVAPPEMLGNLRAVIGDPLAKSVIGELARDLTHLPTTDIATHLEAIIPV